MFAMKIRWLLLFLACFSLSVHADVPEQGDIVAPAVKERFRGGPNCIVAAEALFWKAKEGGLDFAARYRERQNPPVTNLVDGRIFEPRFAWEWGFRLGLGGKLTRDSWDLQLDWTRFASQNKNVIKLPPYDNNDPSPPFVLYTTTGGSNTAGGGLNLISLAKTNWQLDLNLIDLELGKKFFVSKWLALHPFASLRGAQIDQKVGTDYQLETFSTTSSSLSTCKIRAKCKFWGVGLRIGLGSLWSLGHTGWNICADGAFSILPGKFQVSFDQVTSYTTTPSPLPTFTSLFNAEYEPSLSVVTSDLRIGLEWDRSFLNEAYYISLRAGYEQHFFFNQNQFRNFVFDQNRFTSTLNTGDLSTQGLFAGFEFGF